jgi:hypothetical protein
MNQFVEVAGPTGDVANVTLRPQGECEVGAGQVCDG